MKSFSIAQRVCLLTSISCLGFPYLVAGDWLILLFFLGMAVFWIVMKKKSVFWSVSILLIVFVFLAGIGVLANLPTPLMVLACTAALAWWDLANFGQGITNNQPLETSALLEKNHLYALALAVSAALIFVLGSSYMSLQIPFVATVFLVLIAVGGLTYALRSLVRNSR